MICGSSGVSCWVESKKDMYVFACLSAGTNSWWPGAYNPHVLLNLWQRPCPSPLCVDVNIDHYSECLAAFRTALFQGGKAFCEMWFWDLR